MTAQAKLYISLAASFALAAWGAHELLRAAFDPLVKALVG